MREIITKLQPEIIVFTETKLSSGNLLKKVFPEFKICPRSTKVGKCGIAVGVKLDTFQSALDVTESELHDILVVRIGMVSCNIRVILGYGPQETEPVEVREKFFTELEIEITKCNFENDIPLVIGDLNAKIDVESEKIISLSPNGKLLSDLIENNELEVLNFNPLCNGKWTHVIRTTGASSILDYIIVGSDLVRCIDEVKIDEECVFCPFYTRGATKEQQFSDHNAFIVKMRMDHSCKKPVEKETGWKIHDEGLQQFLELTTTNMRQLNTNTSTQKMYNMLENNIYNAMDQCFSRRKLKKVPVVKREYYKTYQSINNFAKRGKAQRQVAKAYIKELLKRNAEAISVIRNKHIINTVQKLTVDNKFSPDSFRRLCKKWKKTSSMSTSVELEDGTEVFEDELIRTAYKDEFTHRLRKRDIAPELQNYEHKTDEICRLRLIESRMKNEPEYSKQELTSVISEIKSKKSPGRDLIPPDVLIFSGNHLVEQILLFMNHIKESGEMVKQWTEVLISPIYKNKGKKKRLVNQRGIFLKQVISKMFEKLNKNRMTVNINQINKFQAGCKPNRSPADQTFMLRAAINHCRYMNRCLYVTLYDYSQCFDSLWLQDCLLSLWKIGVQSETLHNIKILNDTCNIVVKTPAGKTEEFQVKSIVQQGSVNGGILCTASTAEVVDERLGNGTQIGRCALKALTFVDDIAGSNNEVFDTYSSHQKVVWFSSKKRLTLNGPKCMIMGINLKAKDSIPRLKIDGKPIPVVEKAKYLGDMFNKLGNNSDLIDNRVRSGLACIINSMSLCNDITLGAYAIDTLLLLYQSVFIQVVLYNAQAWCVMNEKQMKALKTMQLKFLKRIFHAPSSTPNAVTYLETGSLPIDGIINSLRLNYLHKVLTLDDDDPLKCCYHEQGKYHFEQNWVNEINVLRKMYGLHQSDSDIADMSKYSWKELVKNRITSFHFNMLTDELKQLKHIIVKPYSHLEQQSYLTSLSPQQARHVFQIRANVIDLKAVRKYWYKDTVCRLCGDETEDTKHIVNVCPQIERTFEIELQTDNVEELREMAKRYSSFVNAVKELDESSTEKQ